MKDLGRESQLTDKDKVWRWCIGHVECGNMALRTVSLMFFCEYQHT